MQGDLQKIGMIEGKKAPVKVSISRNFADQKKKEENINKMKKIIDNIEEEKKEEDPAEGDQIMDDVQRDRRRRKLLEDPK